MVVPGYTSLQMSGGRSGVNVCTGYMCFVKCSEYLAVCTAKKFLVGKQYSIGWRWGGGGGGGAQCTCAHA